MLKLLQSIRVRGVPKAGFAFDYYGKKCFLMQKLGADLSRLVENTPGNKFSLKATLTVALQMLKILESVHGCGVIHNDVKPSNMTVGVEDPFEVYLIDFGCSTGYLTGEGDHVKESEVERPHGTWMYMSINRMLKKTPSRRDDLESLAYTLIRLVKGTLPWYDVLRDGKISFGAKMKKVVELKRLPVEAICEGCEEEFGVFLEKVKSLTFDAKPEYKEYYTMFERLLNDGLSSSTSVLAKR